MANKSVFFPLFLFGLTFILTTSFILSNIKNTPQMQPKPQVNMKLKAEDVINRDMSLSRMTWCNGIPGYFRNPGPKVALASYPGSGNTWTRHLLQQLTGVLTGAVYHSQNLKISGFPAEGVTDGRVIAVKTHTPYAITSGESVDSYDKVIVITRNPWDAFLANFNLGQTRSQVKMANMETINSKWQDSYKRQFDIWHKFHMEWGKRSNETENFLLIHYENMVNDLKGQLRMIANFLHLSIDEEVYDCVMNNSKSKFKREKNGFKAENLLNETELLKAKERRDSIWKEMLERNE